MQLIFRKLYITLIEFLFLITAIPSKINDFQMEISLIAYDLIHQCKFQLPQFRIEDN